MTPVTTPSLMIGMAMTHSIGTSGSVIYRRVSGKVLAVEHDFFPVLRHSADDALPERNPFPPKLFPSGISVWS